MSILPKISIIIPLYNVEAYIMDCLQSVARQTYQGQIECIIVDDCSDDNSANTVKRFIAEYIGSIHFISLRHTHSSGPSTARNTGANKATGEYILFLDSDDCISDDCLEILTDRLQENNYQLIIGDYDTFGEKEVPSLLFEKKSTLLGRCEIFHEFAERQLYVAPWNKLCKASFLKEHNIIFNKEQFLHEDDLWSYKCYTCADSIAIQHSITYHYRMRKGSIMETQQKSIKALSSLFDTIQFILENRGDLDATDYEKCALTYISKYLSLCVDSNHNFYTEYKFIRGHFPYSPISLFIHKKLSLMEVKHKFHFALPIPIGYVYLLLRRFKIHHL